MARSCIFHFLVLLVFHVSSLVSSSPLPALRVKLIHRTSLASPFHNTSLSLRQRLIHSWHQSFRRASIVHRIKHPRAFKTAVSAADYGSGAEYLMEMSLGTPPQSFLAVADTGSSLVWLQCAPCHNCTDTHGLIFQPANSSTYRAIPCNNSMCQLLNTADFAYFNPDLLQCAAEKCQFQYLYGDLSTAMGTLSAESVSLQRTDEKWHNVKDFVFGCAHHSENDFFVTGLVGLGPRPYSFTSQLGSVLGPKFSYCLVSFESSLNKSSVMLFGESHAKEKGTIGMNYTPLLNAEMNMSSYYYVSLEGISIGSKRLEIPDGTFQYSLETSGGTIVDSGTTFTVVAAPAYTAIMDELQTMIPYPKEQVSGEYDGLLCYNTSTVKHPSFPYFTLHFNSLDLSLPRENTFIHVAKHSVCLAIMSSGPNFSSDTNVTIIGNIAQQNFYVEFDVQNYRVGFQPSDCDNFVLPSQ